MLRNVVHKAIQARNTWEGVQERFVQDLRDDPANALGWSNKVFTAAAQLQGQRQGAGQRIWSIEHAVRIAVFFPYVKVFLPHAL